MRWTSAAAAGLLLIAATAAADGLRHTLKQEEYALVNHVNLEYNNCLQKKATALPQDQDARVSLQTAVNACQGVLQNLAGEFDKRGIDPGYYQGVLRHLKSNAIRRMLPALMMRQALGGEQQPQSGVITRSQ